MTHLLLHAAGAMAPRTLRLVHLNDIARLAALMTAADWEEVLGPRGHARGAWWALPPLRLTARYYAGVVPAGVLAELEPLCPWLLRRITSRQRLSDVSLSLLRIKAFPGADNPGMLIRFITTEVVDPLLAKQSD